MTITESRLSLDPEGDDFVLRRRAEDGSITSMKLSETDILTLAQSVPNLHLEILKRHDPKGESHLAVSATEVAQVALNQRSLGEAILLTLIAPSGGRSTFAIPEQIAALLVERLPVFLAPTAVSSPRTAHRARCSSRAASN
jgi:hypothetical protein